MNKETFISAINKIVELRKMQRAIDDVYRNHKIDYRNDLGDWYEELIVATLENVMEDTGKWINYWCYELDWVS